MGPTSSAKSHERYAAEYEFNGWVEVFLYSVRRPWRMRRRPKLKFLDKSRVKKANKYPTKRSKTAFSIKEMNKKRVKIPFFSRFFASFSDPSPSSLASLVLSSKPQVFDGIYKVWPPFLLGFALITGGGRAVGWNGLRGGIAEEKAGGVVAGIGGCVRFGHGGAQGARRRKVRPRRRRTPFPVPRCHGSDQGWFPFPPLYVMDSLLLWRLFYLVVLIDLESVGLPPNLTYIVSFLSHNDQDFSDSFHLITRGFGSLFWWVYTLTFDLAVKIVPLLFYPQNIYQFAGVIIMVVGKKKKGVLPWSVLSSTF